MAAQKNIQSTTQKFLDIHDVTNNLVILKDGSVCFVLAVSAMNFGLLAEQEQDAVIYTYAAMLNSLNYPIQIVIQSQTKDATKYLNLLKDQEQKASSEEKAKMIARYRSFVAQLIKERNVLDKKFYVAAPATAMELGLVSPEGFIPGNNQFDISKYEKSVILEKAQSVLEPRRDHLVSQFARIGLFARQLTTQEIIKIFYTNYNPEASEGLEIADTSEYTTPLVRANLIKNQNFTPPKKQSKQTDFSEYYQDNPQNMNSQNQPQDQPTQTQETQQNQQTNQQAPQVKQQPQTQPSSNMPNSSQVKTQPKQGSLTSPSSAEDLALNNQTPTKTTNSQPQTNHANQAQTNQPKTSETTAEISEDITSFAPSTNDSSSNNVSSDQTTNQNKNASSSPGAQTKAQSTNKTKTQAPSKIEAPSPELNQSESGNIQPQQMQSNKKQPDTTKVEKIEPLDKQGQPQQQNPDQQQKNESSHTENIPQPTLPNNNTNQGSGQTQKIQQPTAPHSNQTNDGVQNKQANSPARSDSSSPSSEPKQTDKDNPQQAINDTLKKIDVYNQDNANNKKDQSSETIKQIPEIK
jgi:hypothetical protein